MTAEITVAMNASPDEVWALLSDVTRIGEFSPETFEAEWLGGASGPAVGAKFRGHVKRNGRGPTYWTTCKVTYCEPARDFGFAVVAGDKVINNWRYQLEPTADGCAVTESFTLAPSLPMKLYWAIAGKWRGKTNRDGMQKTLERIKAVVEKG